MIFTTLQDFARQLNRMPWAAWAALAFLFVGIYRFPVPAGNLRVSMQLLFEIIIALSMAIYLIKEVNPWIGAYLILVTVSHLYPHYGPASFMAFSCTVWAGVWMILIIQSGRQAETKTIFLDMMCILSLAHFLYQVVQFFGMDLLYVIPYKYQTVGFMANPNEVGALHAFCFAAFLRDGWKRWIPSVLLGVILSRTSGAMVAIACGLMVYWFLNGKWKQAIALPVILSIGYIIFIDAPGTQRFPVWMAAWQFFTDRPFFGIGIGNWQVLSGFLIHKFGENWTMVHNEFLQGLAEMGIGFGIILLGYAGTIALRVRRFKREQILIPLTALTIIAANSFVGFPLRIAITAGLAVTWVALFEKEFMWRKEICR